MVLVWPRSGPFDTEKNGKSCQSFCLDVIPRIKIHPSPTMPVPAPISTPAVSFTVPSHEYHFRIARTLDASSAVRVLGESVRLGARYLCTVLPTVARKGPRPGFFSGALRPPTSGNSVDTTTPFHQMEEFCEFRQGCEAPYLIVLRPFLACSKCSSKYRLCCKN